MPYVCEVVKMRIRPKEFAICELITSALERPDLELLVAGIEDHLRGWMPHPGRSCLLAADSLAASRGRVCFAQGSPALADRSGCCLAETDAASGLGGWAGRWPG
jgi:hypothetical protein